MESAEKFMIEFFEFQKHKWQDEVISAVIKLAYNDEGAAGICRWGSYFIPEDHFRKSLEEYLKSGESHLDEHGRIVSIIFQCHDNGFKVEDEEDIKLLGEVLNNQGFWNIEELCDEEEEEIVRMVYDKSILYKHHKPKYEYRRRIEFTESIKKPIRERDGNKCTQCGSTNSLEVHHKLPLIQGGNNDSDNLITLCHECHQEEHRILRA